MIHLNLLLLARKPPEYASLSVNGPIVALNGAPWTATPFTHVYDQGDPDPDIPWPRAACVAQSEIFRPGLVESTFRSARQGRSVKQLIGSRALTSPWRVASMRGTAEPNLERGRSNRSPA